MHYLIHTLTKQKINAFNGKDEPDALIITFRLNLVRFNLKHKKQNIDEQF